MPNKPSSSRYLVLTVAALLFAVAVFLTIYINRPQPQESTPVAATNAKSATRETTAVAQPAALPGQDAENPTGPTAADSRPVAAPLEGCEAAMETAGSKGTPVRLTGGDGLFDRVFIAEKTPLTFTLTLPHLTAGREILITAPNGGNLSREGGPLVYKASGTTEKVTLRFEPSIGRGAYTIRIQHRGESQIIDLWAGARNPLGQPGPAYVQQPVSDPKS